MFTQSLIQVAMIAYFSLSAGHGGKVAQHPARKAAANVEDRVVIRESPLSERCGLDLEAVIRPDKDIAALQNDARNFKSSLGLNERAKSKSWELTNIEKNSIHWDEQFAVKWEDDGSYSFANKHFPNRPQDLDFNFSPFIGGLNR